MSSRRISRYETPEYQQARAMAEDLSDAKLEATIDILRTVLAAHGDVLAGRRRKTDPDKLAAVYEALAARER